MNKLLSFRFKKIALLTLFLVSVLCAFAQKQVAIIDAGSSGSRLYVYRIDKKNKLELIFPQNNEVDKSIGKPLSEVVNNKDSVISFVHKMTEKYQSSSPTPLYILATAGMRLQDPSFCKSIYAYMTSNKDYGNYKIEKAMTISGKYEGLYAWMAVNYNNGALGFSISSPKKPLTYTEQPLGIIEIGGASMQIAFATDNSQKDSTRIIKRSGFTVYSKSYLKGGVDQIYKNEKLNGKNGEKNYSIVIKKLPEIKNISFWGLGKPIQIVLDGVRKNGSFQNYILTLGNDAKSEYHPKSNALYVKWLLGQLHLIKNDTPTNIKPQNASWTQGAALDILVNGCEPEPFDYNDKN